MKQISWQALEDGNRELAEYGQKRFERNHVAYLATISKIEIKQITMFRSKI